MRSPVVAMLWENWRLTRLEAAQRLAFGLVAGSAALAFFSGVANERVRNAGVAVAVGLLITQHVVMWLSVAKLNGGRFWDGYQPGFPFHLLYTRPIRTAVIVGVAMAYDAVSCAALYLVSAAVLGLAFGLRLPLLSVAVWIAVFHLAYFACQCATRNRVAQWLGGGAISLLLFAWLMSRADVSPTQFEFSAVGISRLMFRADWSPLQVQFSLADYALMASIGLMSFGLAVAGVSRQRRGDAPVHMPWIADLASLLRRVSQFRSACPISSATRAQVWFALESSGRGVLTLGLAIAMAIPLVFAVSGPIAPVRVFAVSIASFALPAVLLSLGANAFGVRRKQGHIFASAFQATQPYRTARLAGVAVLVRAACLLAALIVVGVSVWASLSLVREWMGEGQEIAMQASYWELRNSQQAKLVGPEAAALWRTRHAINGAAGALTGYEQLALAVVASIGVAVIVAWRAARAALWSLYPRRMIITGALLLLYGLALVLLGIAGRRWSGPVVVMDAILVATPWLAAAAMTLATAYLFWKVRAEEILTLRQVCGAVLVSAAFAAAWVTVLRAAGVPLAGMSATFVVSWLWPTLLPLTASVLAPWSLNRIRHT